MNLTEQQKDLLRLLVAKHESTRGAEFIFVRPSSGAAVCYPGGDSVSIPNDDTDFHQLHREELITLIHIASNQFRGKPTQRGTALVRNDFVVSAWAEKPIILYTQPNISDDPWRANLFPEGTRANQSWKDMMLWAKEHLALFQSEMLENMPPEEAPDEAFADHHLKFLGGEFDIYARALSSARFATPTDEAADAFEHLLTELEKGMIARTNKSPSFIPKQLYASEVKNRLHQRKQYWIGQMLRRVREHKEASRVNDAANKTDGASPFAAKFSAVKNLSEMATHGDDQQTARDLKAARPSLPPDDPQFGLWQVICGILQRDESQAREAVFADFKVDGLRSAILTLVKEGFESCARILVKSATNVIGAEEVAKGLDEALEKALSQPLLQDAELRLLLPPATFAGELRLDLIPRLEHWKKAAFQRGLEGEIRVRLDASKQNEPETSATTQPNPTPAETQRGRSKSACPEPTQISQFPNRSSWLNARLLERGWGNSDSSKFGGPDRKTVEKILRGEPVRNDVLDKLAEALSKKHTKVTVLNIPQD